MLAQKTNMNQAPVCRWLCTSMVSIKSAPRGSPLIKICNFQNQTANMAVPNMPNGTSLKSVYLYFTLSFPQVRRCHRLLVQAQPCELLLSESSPDARSNGITPLLTPSQASLKLGSERQSLKGANHARLSTTAPSPSRSDLKIPSLFSPPHQSQRTW